LRLRAGCELAANSQSPAPTGTTTAPRNPAIDQPVRSPEVDPDRRVTFRLRAPKATEVIVSCEFQGGSAAVRPPGFVRSFAALTADPKAANGKLRLLWIGCGTDDGLFGSAQSFSAFLDDAKIKHTFYTMSGAHTWIVWRNFLVQFAPQLF